MQINYRPDLDGLRALAIISVVLFHAEFKLFGNFFLPGGFLGVDIFFVISGYLITTLILKEIKYSSEFNFFRFYERRSRRILPALILVIIITLIFGLFFLSAAEYVDLNKTILSALLFVSNFYFYFSEFSYNHDLSMLKPLLHTWSLSIEEQFYIFFPLLIWIIYKFFNFNLINLFVILFLLSLSLSVYGSIYHPHFTFFIIITRAWELLAGSIIAYIKIEDSDRINIKSISIKNIASGISLFLIVFILLFYDFSFKHNYLYLFVVILSTSLLIFFDDKNIFFKKFFYNTVLVRIGLISYSMYLFHFPIFAIARSNNFIGIDNLIYSDNISISFSEGNHFFLKVILIVITIILSALSYKFIEKYFRNFDKIKTKTFFIYIFLTILPIVIFSLIVINVNGFKFGKKFQIGNYILDNTHIKSVIDKQREKNLDKLFKSTNKEKVLVIGNSHGIDFYHMLHFNKDLYFDKEFRLYGTQIRCLLRNLKNEALSNPECLSPHKRQNNNINIKNFNDADTIILATRWHDMYDWYAIEHIANYLKNSRKKLYIINNFPEFYIYQNRKGNVIDEYIQKNFLKIESVVEIKELIEKKAFKNLLKTINKIRSDVITHAEKANLEVLDPFDFMCDLKNHKCDFITDNGEKIYYDYGHFSLEGAKYFGKKMYNLGWFR
jgi:peptidoglycan/LPS O-acetylase OafA/YrhL